MRNLLKNYLEDNEVYKYFDVEVYDYSNDGHLCTVTFQCKGANGYIGEPRKETVELNLWEVLAFINEKVNKNTPNREPRAIMD